MSENTIWNEMIKTLEIEYKIYFLFLFHILKNIVHFQQY